MGRLVKVLISLVAILIGYNFYDSFNPGRKRHLPSSIEYCYRASICLQNRFCGNVGETRLPQFMKTLAGKRVLITGGSMGIGEQLAYQYSRLGASVMIVARSEDKLKKVIEGCSKLGHKDGRYIYHVADLSKLDELDGIIKKAERELGGLDYLVLNHIISNFGLWEGTPENMTLIRKTMDLNFFAYVTLASSALPILRKRGGSIVVLNSLAGRTPSMYLTPYSSSKHALNGFFTSLRLEQQSKNTGVSVTNCIIGLVDTDSAMTALTDFGFGRILESAGAAKASDVAYDIIRAAAIRQPEVYTPYVPVNFGLSLNFLFPKLNDMLMFYLYTPS